MLEDDAVKDSDVEICPLPTIYFIRFPLTYPTRNLVQVVVNELEIAKGTESRESEDAERSSCARKLQKKKGRKGSDKKRGTARHP